MLKSSSKYILPLLLIPTLSLADSISEINSQMISTGTGSTYFTGPGVTKQEVRYQKLNGNAITEGDIMLGTVAQADQTLAVARQKNNDFTANSVITRVSSYRWPNNTVPYVMKLSVDQNLHNMIISAMNHWSSNTNIRFVLRTPANAAQFPNFVSFKNIERACWSYVGMQQRGQQDINLHPDCQVRGAVHEIGHAVGLFHEHNRTDRQSFVTINWANIETGMESNFTILTVLGSMNGSRGYDYASVMHYERTAFGKLDPTTGRLMETITPTAQVSIGTGGGLSWGDVAGVNEFYP